MTAESKKEQVQRVTGTEVLEFKLEIGPGSQGEYPVTVESPAGQAQETMSLPLGDLTFDNLSAEMQAAILQSGAPGSEQGQAVQELGRWLFETTFAAETRTLYAKSRRQAEEQGKPLRLMLTVKPAELAVLPWEYLYDPGQGKYICLSNTSMVRVLDPSQAPELPGIPPPLRILGLIASSPDLGLEAEREKQSLESATQTLQEQGLIEVTWVEGQSWDDLQRAFRLGEWHIAHLVVPRGAGQSDGEAFVILANEDGSDLQVSATDLSSLLTRHESTRLVVLSSGRGKKGNQDSHLSATAADLVQKGVPAVLAIEYEISEQATTVFLQACYEALITSPVDLAVTKARNVLYSKAAGSLEWGAPNLYTNSPDMGLLDRETLATTACRRGDEALDGDDFDRAIVQFSLAVELGAGPDAQKKKALAQDVRLTLETARSTFRAPADDPEAQADAIIIVLADLERIDRKLPDSRAIDVELERAQKAALVFRDKLWETARRLMQAKSVGLTLDQRQRRMEESVRLLEKASMLDREDSPGLKQDLSRAMRRINYLQASRAQAQTERGRRWRVYGIIAAALVAILLLLCFGLQQIPFTALVGGSTPSLAPTGSLSDEPAVAQVTTTATAAENQPTGEPVVAQPTYTTAATENQDQPTTAAPTEMPTLVGTAPPVDSPTSVPAGTPEPSQTATTTQAPPATLAPTATEPPPATPTLRPTETAATQSKPATPTPSPIPLPTETPTAGIIYPAPVLLAPEDISALSQATFSTYPLKWEWDGVLEENEWFDVRVWQEGMPHYGVSWTKEREYLYDLCLQGNGIFYWTVAVIRGQEGQWLGDLGPEAEPHQFSSSRSDAWCQRHGRFHLPDRAGQQ